ncbi:MAG: TetR/AcrR family transcriptional regulator [Actinomycetota bacterium]
MGSTRTRVTLDREQRERQLLDVACAVFAEKGYRRSNVADIVGRAGVSRGTFYHYFESREAIFARLLEDYFQRFEAIVEANHDRLMAAILGNGDVIGAWRENTLEVLRFHADRPELTTLIYREAIGLGRPFARRMDRLTGLSKRRLAEEFGALSSRGMIVPFDLELLLLIVNGSVLGLIMEWVLEKKTEDLETLADNFVRYHTRALSPVPAEAPAGREPSVVERRSGTHDRRAPGMSDRRKAEREMRRDGRGGSE